MLEQSFIMRERNADDKPAANSDRGVPATLPEGSLRELINARVVTGFRARGYNGGFLIEASLGTEPGNLAMLGNTRGGPRVFASLGTVAVLLQKFGFNQFVVDSTEYVPGRVRAARPDRSIALKTTAKSKPATTK
jgi:hypothetical protein